MSIWKKIGLFILCLAVPLGVGAIAAWIIQPSQDIYNTLNLPAFAPPGWLFGVVWPILYTLMGISVFIIVMQEHQMKSRSVVIFLTQLFFNFLWPIAFFTWQLFLFSSVWLLVLIGLIALMIIDFYKTNKWAGILQVPYLLWSIFACILNFTIFFMNM